MKNPFSGLFRARDQPGRRPAPRNALNGSAFSFIFGRSAAGKLVNERSAMQMSAVYACVRVLSEAIASMPLHFYRYNDTGVRKKQPIIHCIDCFMMNPIRRCPHTPIGRRP